MEEYAVALMKLWTLTCCNGTYPSYHQIYLPESLMFRGHPLVPRCP